MKYLFFLLLLTGCGVRDPLSWVGIRKFQVGDCLIQSRYEPEKWQNKAQYTVLELGNRYYLIKSIEYGSTMTIKYGCIDECFYQKVPCK